MLNLTARQQVALVTYLKNLEDNDGLHTEYLRDKSMVPDLITALNALDGGDRDPSDYTEDD